MDMQGEDTATEFRQGAMDYPDAGETTGFPLHDDEASALVEVTSSGDQLRRRVQELGSALLVEVAVVLGLEDAGVAGQREFGVVELEQGVYELGLGVGQCGLGLNDGKRIVDAGTVAEQGVRKCFVGKGDVRGGEADQVVGRLDVEHGGADLLVDVGVDAGQLGPKAAELGVGNLPVATEADFLKDGEVDAALGDKVSVVQAARFADDPVVAAECGCGQVLVRDRLALQSGGLDLGLETEKVFAALVGDLLRNFKRKRGELVVGDGVDQFERLVGGKAHEAIELNLVLGKGVAILDELLVALLPVDRGPEQVQVCAGTCVLAGLGLALEFAVGEELGLAVFDGGFVCEDTQVLARNILHDTGTVGKGLEVDDLRLDFRCLVNLVGGKVEELLVQVELGAGDVVLNNGGEGYAGRQQRLNKGGVEAARREVDLLGRGGTGRGKGRNEGVEGVKLEAADLTCALTVDGDNEAVLEAELDRVVKRQAERIDGSDRRGDTCVELAGWRRTKRAGDDERRAAGLRCERQIGAFGNRRLRGRASGSLDAGFGCRSRRLHVLCAQKDRRGCQQQRKGGALPGASRRAVNPVVPVAQRCASSGLPLES